MLDLFKIIRSLDIDSEYIDRLSICFNDLRTLSICISDSFPNSSKLLDFYAKEIVDILVDMCGDHEDA